MSSNSHQQMSCKINSFNSTILFNSSTNEYRRTRKTVVFASTCKQNQQKLQNDITATATVKVPETEKYTISFKTQRACRLGISRYPDFEYNAEGGIGTGVGKKIKDEEEDTDLFVSFDLQALYIPPLTSSTTRLLGLPMPPFLKINIVPEEFQGIVNPESGKVDLEFKAKFLFSVGSIYKAPPLLVKTVLTSEESNGRMRSGSGNRLDKEGKCRLVGVATVDPIDDFLMNSFLGLPTECLANLNAVISIGRVEAF